jgi:hypothetical protein
LESYHFPRQGTIKLIVSVSLIARRHAQADFPKKVSSTRRFVTRAQQARCQLPEFFSANGIVEDARGIGVAAQCIAVVQMRPDRQSSWPEDNRSPVVRHGSFVS